MSKPQVALTLKELRSHSGMTQEEISQKLNIARQTYSSYESGMRVPHLELASQIAELFHISLDQLVFGLQYRTDPFARLPDNYQELLKAYANLSVEGQQQVVKYVQFLEQQKI